MTQFKTKNIDIQDEKRIITGMIVSKEFLQDISAFLNLSYFKNTFAKRIASWCLEFYYQYGKAPFYDIQNIYEAEKRNIEESESEIIAKILEDASERYKVSEKFNYEYLLDETVKYFKKRELEIVSGNIGILLEKGDIEKAEDQIRDFIKVEKTFSDSIDPLEDSSIKMIFEDKGKTFFQLPGALGRFLGEFERGWCVGITGPFKRGKTWIMQEMAVIGMLSNLKVFTFSLEMQKKKQIERMVKRLTALGHEEDREYRYPVFDCFRNQIGDCTKRERTNDITLMDSDGELPAFDPDSSYRTCSYCRRRAPADYQMAIWYEMLYKKGFNEANVFEKMKPIQDMFKGSFRMKTFPRFSANVQDIKRELDLLERTEGFIPDIVVVDYADILKPEGRIYEGYQKEDETWMALAGLAMERHILVVTGTQAKASALEAENVTQKHTSRWVGKLGHVDAMFALNQTELEKARGIMRISKMAHRHEDFLETATCTVLQKISHGQFHLDSHF